MGQTSNLGRVEPMNWIRLTSNFSRPAGVQYQIFSRKRLNIHHHTNFLFISVVRLMWRSTFVPGKRFWSLRFIRLVQTDRTCSDELNWARRRPFHEFNSLGLVRLMKSSTFGLVLSVLTEMLSDQETLWQEYGCNVYSIGFNLGLFIYNQGNCFSSCWRDKTERKLGNIFTWCLRQFCLMLKLFCVSGVTQKS